MQAIRTHYIGPTNYRPGRIKATCQAGQITVSWDHGLNPTENHREAARALREKLGWQEHHPDMVGGGLPDGSMAWVFQVSDHWAEYKLTNPISSED